MATKKTQLFRLTDTTSSWQAKKKRVQNQTADSGQNPGHAKTSARMTGSSANMNSYKKTRRLAPTIILPILFIGELIGLFTGYFAFHQVLDQLSGSVIIYLVSISLFILLGVLPSSVLYLSLLILYKLISISATYRKNKLHDTVGKLRSIHRLAYYWLLRPISVLLIALIYIISISLITMQTIKSYFVGPPGFSPRILFPKQNEEGAKNLIFISVDTLRFDAFNDRLMPNITRLASEGLMFTKAFSPSPWTFPAFLSFFTGKYLDELTPKDAQLPNDVLVPDKTETLAEVLNKNGYQTQFIGSNGYLISERGFAQGFDGFLTPMDSFPYQWDSVAANTFLSSTFFSWLKDYYIMLTGLSHPDYDARADWVINYAIDWLKKNKNQPFFLWVHVVDPHDPYDPPGDFLPEPIRQANPQRVKFFIQTLQDINKTLPTEKDFSAEDKKILRDLYNGEVVYADFQLSRLFYYLQKNNYFNNSVIVFIADHGEEFFDHGKTDHGHSFYNELIHVPFVLWLPDKKSAIIDKPVNLVNFMPTILDILGFPADEFGFYREQNFLINRNPSPPFQTGAIYQGENLISVIDWPFKLIYNRQTTSGQLYRLDSDFTEKANIISNFPQKYHQLREKILNQLTVIEHSRDNFFRQSSGKREKKQLNPVVGY